MKKCCIITTVHPPFDARIFHRQAKTLVKVGYKVSLIVQHDRHEIVDDVEIIPLPRTGFMSNRATRVLSTITALKLAIKQKADVYHFHDPELLPVGWLLRKWTGKPIIYDVHEHYPNQIMDKYWIPSGLRSIVKEIFELMESIIVPSLSAVVYTTPIVGERYIKMPIRTERLENLPLSSAFSNYRRVQKFDQTTIIYVGNTITRIRGLRELIEAFSYLIQKNHNDIRLLLIGQIVPDEFKSEMRSLIKQLNLDANIKVIDPVPYEKLNDYLFEADIGIIIYLPYANNMSCLPNKLFEYMACGLPVVASDFPLYREIVDKVGFGLLVDPTSPKSIAEAMEKLVMDSATRNQMSQQARKSFVEEYNWESESGKLLKLYSELLSDQDTKLESIDV